MKKTILLLTALCCTTPLFAQRLDLDFEKNPTIHTIANKEFEKESAIIILEQEQLLYTSTGDKKLSLEKVVHKIVKVNDEKGVEMFNKIKIPFSERANVYGIRARTILPNGKVVKVANDDVKEVKDDDGTMYKLFAMQGVEQGAEIEYTYRVMQPLQLYGSSVMQDQIPTCINEFEIVAPKTMLFELRGYNGLQVLDVEKLEYDNSYVARAENLPGLQEEKYATYLPHFARLQYVLAKDTKGEAVFTWKGIAGIVYRDSHVFSNKQLKNARNILDDNKEFDKCKTLKSKIEFIEQYVKKNYQQQEFIADENASSMEYAIKNKYTNEAGIINLFSALFSAHDIPFEIGYTNDKTRLPFDYEFETPNGLKECVFYFKGLNQFMAPNATFFRMPFVPTQYCNTPILVTNSTDDKNIKAEKKIIPDMPPEASSHDHDVDVRFNEDMDTAIIKYDNYFLGYNAADMLPSLIYLDKDKIKEFTKQVLSINDKEERMDNFEYENVDFKSLTDGKKLKIAATIYASNSLEKAGLKYLFKIGELIGRQSEMYQEKTRQFDLEIPNPHQYTRTIKVHIPKGLRATNLESLKMNVAAKNGTKEICSFKSDYTLVDDLLTVNVFEIYYDTFTPKSFNDAYVKVINAAADFNKVVIVLAK